MLLSVTECVTYRPPVTPEEYDRARQTLPAVAGVEDVLDLLGVDDLEQWEESDAGDPSHIQVSRVWELTYDIPDKVAATFAGETSEDTLNAWRAHGGDVRACLVHAESSDLILP